MDIERKSDWLINKNHFLHLLICGAFAPLIAAPVAACVHRYNSGVAIREGYKMAIPIYRGVRAVIQAVSGIPWYVADKNGEIIENHHFTKTWRILTPNFSGQDNMEYLVAHLILGGVAYLRPIYSFKKIPQECG